MDSLVVEIGGPIELGLSPAPLPPLKVVGEVVVVVGVSGVAVP